MNSNLFKAMRQKKKREVNPDAPPRPNLMTHDVKIREQNNSIAMLSKQILKQEEKIRQLENKLNNQTAFLQTVYSKLNK